MSISSLWGLKVKDKIYVDIISGRSLKSVYVCGHYLMLGLKVKYKIYVDIISGRSLQVKSVYVCGHYLNAEIPSPNSRARVLQSLSSRVGVNNL